MNCRYAGYCAWRGILDFSEDESSKKTVAAVKEAYPDLGKCLYFDLGRKTHAVLYELPNEKLNWIWYVNQAEPELKGNSVTMKVSDEAVEKMRKEAEKTWSPSLARAMKETREPFVNVIYDCDPLERLVWDGVVVLVGDAAHPTTPHGLRSTNMSLLDAAVLGACVEKLGKEGLDRALEEYQSVRLPVVAHQVLHSRRMGRIKQGFVLEDREIFDPIAACPEDCEELKQNSMPFFGDVPLIVDFNLNIK